MKTYLKIKIASLAAEARAIHKEEKKWKKPSFSQYKKDVRYWLREGRIPDLEPNPADYGKPATPPHPMYFSLEHHRKHVVRPETRASLLAYGFMRDVPYSVIEERYHEAPNWERVEQIAAQFTKKYGSFDERKFKQRFEEWFQRANDYIEGVFRGN